MDFDKFDILKRKDTFSKGIVHIIYRNIKSLWKNAKAFEGILCFSFSRVHLIYTGKILIVRDMVIIEMTVHKSYSCDLRNNKETTM